MARHTDAVSLSDGLVRPMSKATLRISLAEFNVIAKLLRSRDPARTATRQVLVDGLSYKDSAARAGCTPMSARNAARRYCIAYKQIVQVFGTADE